MTMTSMPRRCSTRSPTTCWRAATSSDALNRLLRQGLRTPDGQDSRGCATSSSAHANGARSCSSAATPTGSSPSSRTGSTRSRRPSARRSRTSRARRPRRATSGEPRSPTTPSPSAPSRSTCCPTGSPTGSMRCALRVHLERGARAARAAARRAARAAAGLVLRGDARRAGRARSRAAAPRLREGMDALSRMLEQRERGEDLDPTFEEFMAAYGDLFGPADTLDELLENLARRLAAARAMFDSLSPGAARRARAARASPCSRTSTSTSR